MNIDQEQPQRVAVYGTLKRGHHANDMLNPGTFIGAGASEERFDMMDTGGFPMLLMPDTEGEGNKIAVEVYEVPASLLTGVLDRYESVPSLYTRKIVPVTLNDGTVTAAWIYVGSDEDAYHTYDPMHGVNGVVSWPEHCQQRKEA